MSMKLLSWNVDGLGETHVEDRARAALNTIVTQTPDLIFLQEVVSQNHNIFLEGLTAAGYQCKLQPPRSSPYYTMCYIKVSSVDFIGAQRLAYSGEAVSGMMRDIIKLDIKFKGHILSCLSSHLESTAQMSKQRTAQLVQLTEIACGCQHPALIVGDLNMRDKEAEEAVFRYREALVTRNLSPYVGLNDAYFHFNKPKDARITWVPPNSPNSFSGCRFDRIYHNCDRAMQYTSLKLVGQNKIFGLGMTPSDHFGLVVGIGLLDVSTATTSIALSTGNVGIFQKALTLSKNRIKKDVDPASLPILLEVPVGSANSQTLSPNSHVSAAPEPFDVSNYRVRGVATRTDGGIENDVDDGDEDLRRALALSLTEESQPQQIDKTVLVSYDSYSGADSSSSTVITSGDIVGESFDDTSIQPVLERKRHTNDKFLAAFDRREKCGRYTEAEAEAECGTESAIEVLSTSPVVATNANISRSHQQQILEVIDLT